MRTNRVKANLREGKPSYGIGTLWPSPEMVEFCGYHGFDWLWIDVEHGAFDLNIMYNIARAAEVSGMVPIARLPKTNDLAVVLKYLETGMMGIIMPHVETRADIEFAVQAIKYPPVGHRSAGVYRAANWGVTQSSKEYYETSNRETIVMALIESTAGLENLDEILSVEGLDAVVIGYGDLSLTLGHPGQKSHPELLELGKRAKAKILASKVALQVTAQNGDEARQAIEEGALMVRCTIPSILGPALKTWLKSARS